MSRIRRDYDVIPESDIQSMVEQYLGVRHVPFLRIPDVLFDWIFGKNSVPLWVKAFISKYMAGWPDLLVFKKDSKLKYWSVLFLELKRKGGEFNKMQKKKAKIIDMEKAESVEEAIEKIDEFLGDAGNR